MNYSLVGYSPYRNALRQQKMQENAARESRTATTEIMRFHISPAMLITLLLAMVILIGGLYVVNFNKIATKGYILKRLEISRQELQEQNDVKTLNLANAKAMTQMIDSGALDHMRKPNNVSYVFTDSVLAKAD